MARPDFLTRTKLIRRVRAMPWATVGAECVIFFGLVLGLDAVLGNGDRFFGVEPHPFWLLVLAMSVQYGSGCGVLVACVSTAVLLAWNLPEHRFGQDLYQYWIRVVIDPVLWLCAAVLLGEISLRHIRRRNDAERELERSKERESILASKYLQLERVQELLSRQVASNRRTSATLMDSFAAMNRLDPAEVIAGVPGVIEAALDVTKFAIYLVSGQGLELVSSHGGPEERMLSPRYDSDHALVDLLLREQRVLSAAEPGVAELLGGETVFVAPLLNPEREGALLGILRVEDIDPRAVSFSTVASLRVLSEWISRAYYNALRHQALSETRFLERDVQIERERTGMGKIIRRALSEAA